jgi:hypothetical protein
MCETTNADLTSRIVYRMMSVLAALVIELPIGTNLGLWRVLGALVSGQLLNTRGALIRVLSAIGLSDGEVMQAGSAFANGNWRFV